MSRVKQAYNAEQIERSLAANRQPARVDYWENVQDVTRYTLRPSFDIDAQAVKQTETDLAAIFRNVGAVVRGIGKAAKIVFWIRP